VFERDNRVQPVFSTGEEVMRWMGSSLAGDTRPANGCLCGSLLRPLYLARHWEPRRSFGRHGDTLVAEVVRREDTRRYGPTREGLYTFPAWKALWCTRAIGWWTEWGRCRLG